MCVGILWQQMNSTVCCMLNKLVKNERDGLQYTPECIIYNLIAISPPIEN